MPTPTRKPVLVLTLIITMLLLSVGAIALIVLFNANRPDSAAIAAACKSEVGAAIKTESDRVAAACNETARSAVKTLPAIAGSVGFNYPATWSVAIVKDETGRVIHASPEYIDLTAFPDITGKITVQIHPNDAAAITKAGSFLKFVESQTALSQPDPLTPTYDIREAKINNQNVIIARYGIWNGPAAGGYEIIYFEGKTTYATVELYSTKVPESNGGIMQWDELFNEDMGGFPIDSLDFSMIQ